MGDEWDAMLEQGWREFVNERATGDRSCQDAIHAIALRLDPLWLDEAWDRPVGVKESQKILDAHAND